MRQRQRVEMLIIKAATRPDVKYTLDLFPDMGKGWRRMWRAQVGDERFSGDEIRHLYESGDYPLPRRAPD